MRDILHSLPKIELHRHLEGAWRLETLCAIAHEYCLPIPAYDPESMRPYVQIMPHDPRTSESFLSKFRFLRQFFRSSTIIKRAVHEAIADAAADNVRYMELRFTPQALNNIMRCDYGTVIEWVCDAAQAAASEHRIMVRLIVSMNRHESPQIGQIVLEAALAFRDRGVVAVDLAGAEDGRPSEPFQPIFERAKAEGFFVTIHAGEWAGAHSVRTAVERLGADRIGHGVRVIEDPTLVDQLARRGTVFEVCPTSNVDSGVVSALRDHPLPKLMASGLITTVNTDDPLISAITLTDQFEQLMVHLGWTLNDFKAAQIAAARSVFLSDRERAALVAQFESWLDIHI